jgi:hypothetical protein
VIVKKIFKDWMSNKTYPKAHLYDSFITDVSELWKSIRKELPRYPGCLDSLKDAFAATMTAGECQSGVYRDMQNLPKHLLTPFSGSDLDNFLESDRELRKDAQIELFAEAIRPDHAIFITTDGQVGSSRKKIRVGDKVCLLFGGRVLYLLRPKEKDGEKFFRFVRPCYVHGFMNGEALKMWQNGGIEPEYFDLR